MNKILIALGTVFSLVGAVVLASVLLRSPDPVAPPSGPDTVVENQRQAQPPSPVWSIGAGLSVAFGAALIAIGMNRWRRFTEPEDEPEPLPNPRAHGSPRL